MKLQSLTIKNDFERNIIDNFEVMEKLEVPVCDQITILRVVRQMCMDKIDEIGGDDHD